MGTKLVTALAALSLALSPAAAAEESLTAEEWSAKLGWKTGDIEVAGGSATLHFADGFRYLDPSDSRRVLVDAWGNPPETAENVLGMIFPEGVNPATEEGWGVVMSFESDGYVSDEGAEGIDYAAMLKQMQEEARQVSEERVKQGLAGVELVGWAETPHYNKPAHKLYWAKELRFGDGEHSTLNYNIRVLGRRGVLVLNAVAGMDQLSGVKGRMEQLLPKVEFVEGHRYTDYVPGKDKVAEYGFAALVGGLAVAAAKGGLLKWLVGGAIALKKLWIGLAVGGAAAIRRLFSRRSQSPPGEGTS